MALGQLKRLPLGRRRGVRPLERLVQRVGVRGARGVVVHATAQARVVRLQPPARRLQRGRNAVAQRVELRDAAAEARDERALLGAHDQQRRERAGHAAPGHVPVERVRVRRARPLSRAAARLHAVGRRHRAVDAHQPAVHHAARVVHLPTQAARVQRVLPQPVAAARAPGQLLQLAPLLLHALAALAHEHAGRRLVPRLLLEEGRLGLAAPLARIAQRLGHRHEALPNVEVELVELGLQRLGVVPVRLGRVVQDGLAHALHLGQVARVVAHAAGRVGVQVGVDGVDAHLRGGVEVLHGARVLGLGHLARHVRRALGHGAPHVHQAVLGGALLRAVGLDGATNLVHVILHLFDHAPLLLGVGDRARLLRVEPQLGQRAAHVRHVLAARGGEVDELRTAKGVGEQTLRLVEKGYRARGSCLSNSKLMCCLPAPLRTAPVLLGRCQPKHQQ